MKNSKYVILRDIENNNTFFTGNDINESELEKCKLNTGEVVYEIIGYANTVEEAQKILFPTKIDEWMSMANYITKLTEKIYGDYK